VKLILFDGYILKIKFVLQVENLKVRIWNVIITISRGRLPRAGEELEFRLDVLRATQGSRPH
jgi:hypothetical protein